MSTGGVPLCRTADVPPNGMRACAQAGKEYLVTQQDGVFHVFQHKCPHRGGPLSKGCLQDGVVTCPWHSSKFDVRTGKLVTGPKVGPEVPFVRKFIALFVRNLREYPSVVNDGMLYLQNP
jgi:nitrite reductase/ring-hydroxylating ferredoxin subunit